VLRRHGLQHRRLRLALVAGVMAPPEPPPRPGPQPERHLQVDRPGELVQIDCFYIGRLSGTKGTVWQYSPPTSSPPTPGLSSESRPKTPQPVGLQPWLAGSPRTCSRVASSWSGS
jgi:hypothetical protein